MSNSKKKHWDKTWKNRIEKTKAIKYRKEDEMKNKKEKEKEKEKKNLKIKEDTRKEKMEVVPFFIEYDMMKKNN